MRKLLPLLLLTLSTTLRAESPPASAPSSWKNPDPSRYLFEDAIKPGMKGHGLTCLQGGKIEKFSVEVIDVMKNYAPGSNAILVRCTGLNLEHSGVVAGMSGSPVYIDGKLIGAVAFDWPLAKDPLAGVQPIRQMLAISSKKTDAGAAGAPGAAPLSTWRSNKALTTAAAKHPAYRAILNSFPADRSTKLAPARSANTPALQPIAAPLMLTSASAESLAFLRDALEHTSLVPINSGSAGTTSATSPQLGGAADLKPDALKLEPGASVCVPVISGDMDLSAIGTVTDVHDGKIYAFGHAMLADGPSSLPIATTYIYSIMPHMAQSFKLGSSYQIVGSLLADENAGIVGTLGKAPAGIPVKLRVHSADGTLDRTYTCEIARHPRLTSALLGLILNETLSAQRNLPKHHTARVTGQAKFESTTIDLDLLGATETFDISEALLPISLLADNPFKNLRLESITLDAKIESVDRSAEIKSVTLSTTTAAPGDTLTATVEYVPFHQPPKKTTLSITIPKDAPEGDHDLCIGSAEILLGQEVSEFPHRFEPETIDTLVSSVNNVLAYRKDKLYARLLLDTSGAATAGRERTNLPASKRALLSTSKRPNITPLRTSHLTTADLPNTVLSGGQTLTLTINKSANTRFFTGKSQPSDSTDFPSLKRPNLTRSPSGPLNKNGDSPFPDH